MSQAAAAATAGAQPELNASNLSDLAADGGEMDAAAGEMAQAAPGAAAEQIAAAPLDASKVIKTADLSVEVTVAPVPETGDPTADREADAAARAAAIAQTTASVRSIATTAGGFQASADGGGSSMTISLRVPAEQYDAVIDKLAALGELTSRIETSQDVTAEVVDVNSRVESMTASVARVRALLAQASDIADVISIESELAVREANLESLQQQQAYLSGQVAMSTISLSLTAVTDDGAAVEPVAEENGFVAGLSAGWIAFLDFFGWLGGVLGAVLPFLVLLAVAGLLIWLAVRRTRRRGNSGPDGPPSTPAPTPTPPPAADREDALTPAS